MDIKAHLPKGRDLRLDLFRGIANWAIFLDHIPNNAVNWITTRNYGFSDAADLFVFISGYTASFVYARMMIERGFIVGATRLFKRVWQLYVAHVLSAFNTGAGFDTRPDSVLIWVSSRIAASARSSRLNALSAALAAITPSDSTVHTSAAPRNRPFMGISLSAILRPQNPRRGGSSVS
jgi:peptidoglycan/LPS O-acetylase OafA/YrhL